jgi:hypothetical protein
MPLREAAPPMHRMSRRSFRRWVALPRPASKDSFSPAYTAGTRSSSAAGSAGRVDYSEQIGGRALSTLTRECAANEEVRIRTHVQEFIVATSHRIAPGLAEAIAMALEEDSHGIVDSLNDLVKAQDEQIQQLMAQNENLVTSYNLLVEQHNSLVAAVDDYNRQLEEESRRPQTFVGVSFPIGF